MTLKLIVILILILGIAYKTVLNIVKYRSANNPIPESVSDVYDSETYLKWKKYSAETCRVSIVFTLISGVITIILLATKAYASFAGLFPGGVFWQLLAVVILEVAIGTVVEIIERYFSVMVVEQKYGFNRTSVKTFIFDRFRSLALSAILSLGLVCLLWGLHSLMGDWLIILFAAALFAINLAVSFLYPVFSRIGNKFTPLEDGELKDRLMELLTKHGYKVKSISVMDASRRTTKLNAYFTGFGKMKTIVLYDNLVNTMSTDEICAVFAHELGHGLHKDVLKMQLMNIGNLLIMAVIAWITLREGSLHVAFGFTEVNYGFAYILIGIVLEMISPAIAMIMNAYSRRAEYIADRQAASEGYGPAMVTALKKLARENFAHLAPSKINVVMEYSHPPLASRIEEVEKAIKK